MIRVFIVSGVFLNRGLRGLRDWWDWWDFGSVWIPACAGMTVVCIPLREGNHKGCPLRASPAHSLRSCAPPSILERGCG